VTTVVRPLDSAEAAAAAALINAHAVALHGEPDLSPGTIREWLANEDAEIRVADVDGKLACYGDLLLSVTGARADLDIREHPEHQGLSRVMLDELEAIAGDRGATTVRVHVVDEDVSLAAVLAERGYSAIRHSYRMLVSLDVSVGEPQWPEGIAVRTMAEGEERAVRDASNDAFADHWGFEEQPYERWASWWLESERFDRSLNFVAVDDDQIAGICLCSTHWSDDPGYGWVQLLGVRPAWRRRGIGLALLLHSFAEFRRRGCDRVGLGVDAQSTTGALELYTRAGMHVERRTDALERPV
jgi:mycothiol synthase